MSGGWVGGRVAGSSDNITISSFNQVEVEVQDELGNTFTYPPRQSPSQPSIPEVKGDLRGSFYGHQEQQKMQIRT